MKGFGAESKMTHDRKSLFDDDEPTAPGIAARRSAAEPARSAQTRALSPRAQGPRVLVIDDSDVSRLAMAEALSAVGCQVFQLPSAIGATRMILRHDIRAAVVDVNMPGLTGDKLIAVLRNNPRLSGLVIVVVSGRPDVELDAIRAASGADGALEKSRIATGLWPLLTRLLANSSERGAR
jgi:two-component system, OmpR family, response regulator